MTKKERRIEILEIGDPENCPGCRRMEVYLKDLTRQHFDVSFSFIPYSFVQKNSIKAVRKIKKLYGKLPRSIPVVIIEDDKGLHIFDGDTGFKGMENLI